MTKFVTSAEATKGAQNLTVSRFSRAIGSVSADRLVRGLRAGLAQAQAQDSGTAEPRLYGYGFVKVDTFRVRREVTSDGKLHLVEAITADEIDGVLAVMVDDVPVYTGDFPGQIEAGTNLIFTGRHKNLGSKITIQTGAPGQTADGNLTFATSADSSFVGKGIAYTYCRFGFKTGLFDGDPDIAVIARLRKPVDPRGGTPKWSFNPYVQAYDLFTKSKDIGGAGVSADKINTASFSAGANWADAVVSTQEFTKTAILTTGTNTPLGNELLEFNQSITPFNYGDVVRVSAASGQSMPSGLSPGVDYHVIVRRHQLGDFQVPAISLAASLDDALNGVAIAQGARSSELQVKKVGEIRFMTGFTYQSSDDPIDVALKLLESCGASIYFDDGEIHITRQVFPDTIETVTEDELIGAVALSNRLPSEERATELTGTYTSAINLFIEKDYPKVGGAVFEALDNGERTPARFNLPFAGKAGVAQRQAAIKLRLLRQERTLAFSGSLELYRLKPGVIFSLTKPSLGLDANTTFQVRDQTVFVDINASGPFIGVNIEARQLESTTFDLDVSDEQLVESAIIPGFDTPFDVDPPGTPSVAESLYQTTDGGGVRVRATVTWTASPGGFIEGYVVSFKLTSDTIYRQLPRTPDLEKVIDDIAPGEYNFRVVAENSVGLPSEPSEAVVTIAGLAAPPSALANFTAQVVGVTVVLTWDQSPDLDVKIGGKIEVYHHADTAGSLGESAVLMATTSGDAALAQVPFKRGTYYVRAVDQSGAASGFSEFSLDTRRPVPFGQLISSGVFTANDATEDQVTIQEDPDFPSTNVLNTTIEDDPNDWIELAGAESWDDITDIDAVDDIDAIGGDGEVASEGVYYFSSGISLAAVTRMAIETVIETEIVDESASWDAIANIDDVADIDAIGAGTAQPGQADAWVECRLTRDDPTASPTWGPWQRVDTGIFNHRGVEFRAQLRSYSATVNIRVKQLRVLVRELPVDF